MVLLKNKMVLPKLKKKIGAFLLSEEGKISKESLIKVGAVLAAVAIGTSLLAEKSGAHYNHSESWSSTPTHDNSVVRDYAATDTATGKHGHHASHSNVCNNHHNSCTHSRYG